MELVDLLALELHFLYARNPAQSDLHLLGHERKRPVGAVALQVNADHGQPVVHVKVVETGRVHFWRQLIQDGQHLEAQLVETLLVVNVVQELDHHRGALAVRRGADELHVVQIVQGFFDLVGDQGFHFLWRSAGEEGLDIDLAHGHVGIAVHRYAEQAEGAHHHEDDEHQVHQHRTVQNKIDQLAHGG
jgi:hypothetical protein